MSELTLTLSLPESLYRQLKTRATRSKRSVEEETVDILAAAVPAAEELPADLAEALTPLSVLDDESLWRAARSALAAQAVEEMEALHRKRGTEGLTAAEAEALAGLVAAYERAMLVRAQAAALLRRRGHDVSGLLGSP